MNDQPTVAEMLGALRDLEESGFRATLLGIGPMSEPIVRAALEVAREEDFPAIFIASRNQVDSPELGGGYVLGWDQADFGDTIGRIAGEVGFDGPLYLCRDHGGPWLRDNERRERLPEAEAMRRAKASYLADLLAGFHLLHIDPTVDPRVEGQLPLETVLRRTLELVGYVEGERGRRGLARVAYEVGTEETAGGLTDAAAFGGFLDELLRSLDARGLPAPEFIVGQTGTLIRMDANVGRFDAGKARELAAIARGRGVGFKEHNADFLDIGLLRRHPALGITGANTGPSFSVYETASELELARREEEGWGGHSCPPGGRRQECLRHRWPLTPSDFVRVLERAAVRCGRWRKWLGADEARLTEEDVSLDAGRRRTVARVCGRYVCDDPEVARARGTLYSNLRALGQDPARRVVEDVKREIREVAVALNLRGATSRILETLSVGHQACPIGSQGHAPQPA